MRGAFHHRAYVESTNTLTQCTNPGVFGAGSPGWWRCTRSLPPRLHPGCRPRLGQTKRVAGLKPWKHARTGTEVPWRYANLCVVASDVSPRPLRTLRFPRCPACPRPFRTQPPRRGPGRPCHAALVTGMSPPSPQKTAWFRSILPLLILSTAPVGTTTATNATRTWPLGRPRRDPVSNRCTRRGRFADLQAGRSSQ